MAESLKSNTYLTLEDTKEYLGIPNPGSANAKDNLIIRFINTATAMVESYIDGPVLAKEYVTDRDGTDSNVITLEHRPVISIESIKVDYDRAFDDSTELLEGQYVLRGSPEIKQLDAEITIVGNDIVLRDDNDTALLGRLLEGSPVQSIRVEYTAGWATEADTVPDDIKTATLMLIEHLYMIRENKDVGIQSRDSMGGQSYQRTGDRIPKVVQAMLDPYVDVSFSPMEVPQNNSYGW